MASLAQSPTPSYDSEHNHLLTLTMLACHLAKTAVTAAGDGLTHRSAQPFQAVLEAEKELDRLDREFDESIAGVLLRSTPEQARELLACLKFMVDLERIGDLVAGFVSRAQAVSARVDMEDIHDLVHMTAALEKMLVDVYHAFSMRDLDSAIAVLRADAEIDRLRNLLYVRHVENPEGAPRVEGTQVLLMAQALERAGDHAKNLAEEVCHLVSGHSVRHLLKRNGKSEEQMYLDWLRDQYSE